jgi:hypothetical protein
MAARPGRLWPASLVAPARRSLTLTVTGRSSQARSSESCLTSPLAIAIGDAATSEQSAAERSFRYFMVDISIYCVDLNDLRSERSTAEVMDIYGQVCWVNALPGSHPESFRTGPATCPELASHRQR